MDDTSTQTFPIIDYLDEGQVVKEPPTKRNTDPLPESFGRNLDTLEKARLWLTNPHNWHTSKLFILKWNGLLCTVNEEHGRRLIEETWDDGLPWCVAYGQERRRRRGEAGEEMEESPGAGDPLESSE